METLYRGETERRNRKARQRDETERRNRKTKPKGEKRANRKREQGSASSCDHDGTQVHTQPPEEPWR